MPTPPELSDRHKELLRLEGRDLTPKEAARELNISPHTVKSHWRVIMERFEPVLAALKRQRSRANVVLVALSLGILSMADIELDLSDSAKDASHAPDFPERPT
jgi:DNA-binding NarL/FixJ family response regulator